MLVIEIFTFLLHVVCLVTIERFEWSKQRLRYQGPKLHYRVTVLCRVVCILNEEVASAVTRLNPLTRVGLERLGEGGESKFSN